DAVDRPLARVRDAARVRPGSERGRRDPPGRRVRGRRRHGQHLARRQARRAGDAGQADPRAVRGDDPDAVRAADATEDGLRARASVYQGVAAEEAQAIALGAVAEAHPRRVLEVGCGWGDFAKRVAGETGADVVALDLSPRMVELACAQGVDARVG